MRMGKTESGFNSSYCAFSAGKGALSGQNYVPSHAKGHFSENGQKEKGNAYGIKRVLGIYMQEVVYCFNIIIFY